MEADVLKSIDLFERAIERDPYFALAWTGLANAKAYMASTYRAPHEMMPSAKAAAEEALELDPDLAAAHVTLGKILLVYDWDWPRSLLAYQRALELNPDLPEAHLGLSLVLVALGRFDEGLAEARRAEAMLPYSTVMKYDVGLAYYFAREYDEAVRVGREIVEVDPDLSLGYGMVGLALTELKQYDEAIAASREAVRIENNPILLAFLLYTYAVAGEEQSAREGLTELLAWTEAQYVCPYEVATVYVGLQEHDTAIAWFQKAFDARADCFIWGAVDPRMDAIREDERYRDLLRRVGHNL